MRDPDDPLPREESGDFMAGDRRIARTDSALPDWHVPDGSYRPIPIVWFAGAFLLQMLVLTVLFFALIAFHPVATIACALLVTAWIAHWTWERGIAQSGAGWKIATVAVLAMQLGLVVLGAAMRF